MRLPDTYLSLRHDVEVVAVQGEGHVSQDGAPILDDGYRLILDAAVRRPVDTNLKKNTNRSQIAIYTNMTAGVGKQAEND